MSSEYVIEAEGLGKRYLLGEDSTSLRMKQALHAIAPRWMTSSRDELWAVRNASFKIRQGEAIGVIGGNGAGKSTLLKLLSRITPPTEGHAKITGRVGTLLEVGTGFHPELTGHDNVFLSGSILGMHPADVARKYDEIVAFAELEQFMDTPVKRYSSGMYCRLAFAVASFLDPDIMIVDEVLAVGDAGFQRKSLGRLNDASEREGRTVLFVSHNFQAIRTFCRRVIVLNHGSVVFDGPTEDGLELYLKALPSVVNVRGTAMKNRLNRASGAVQFTDVAMVDKNDAPTWKVRSNETVRLRFGYEVKETVPDLAFVLHFGSAENGSILTAMHEVISAAPLSAGKKGTIEMTFPKLPFRAGEISIRADLQRRDARVSYDVLDSNVALPFMIVTSQEADPYLRAGHISIDYQVNDIPAPHVELHSSGQE